MDEGNAGYGYQGPRFEFVMCTYATSDSIRRYVGASKRKCLRPDNTLDEMQVKMVILTCMTSAVASRLEAAVGKDCRARDADEQTVPVRRDFLDDQTTWMAALLRFERLFAPPDAVAHACEAGGGYQTEVMGHRPDTLDREQDRQGTS